MEQPFIGTVRASSRVSARFLRARDRVTKGLEARKKVATGLEALVAVLGPWSGSGLPSGGATSLHHCYLFSVWVRTSEIARPIA